MTETTSSGSADAGTRAIRPQTGRTQALNNKIVRGMLVTPGISSVIGKFLLTVYAVGRKTGRRYSVPVAYIPHEGKLLFGTGFAWAKNLRTGEPVDIRYKGKRVTCDVEVFTGEEDVTRLYAVICRANKTFAGFNKIGYGADGEPDPADLHAAWRGGARAYLLRPRA